MGLYGKKKPGKYPFLENIIREAEDVMDYIDSWEPDDEDDELDEEALWAPVRSHFFTISRAAPGNGIWRKG